MKILNEKRCIIGEGPIWNEFEKKLYFTNGFGNEICIYDIENDKLSVFPSEKNIAAFAFSKDKRMIVSRLDGIFYLNPDGTTDQLYDTTKHQILYGNDMKVGPDGRLYVGTLSSKKMGISDAIDGKLCSIDKSGKVNILLEGLDVSNGLEWSIDETKFYHTDSETDIINEYDFDKNSGNIKFTGRTINIPGVDGFTINKNNQLVLTRWSAGLLCIIDTVTMTVTEEIELPGTYPASCGFAGNNMDLLAITTSSRRANLEVKTNAGFTILVKMETGGRKPYLFG